jgi:hypothetical protein
MTQSESAAEVGNESRRILGYRRWASRKYTEIMSWMAAGAHGVNETKSRPAQGLRVH